MGLRIGILGGMFDPIHIGHCILAEQCIEQADLHQCYLVPAYQTPLRTEYGHATPYQRWMMTRIVARTNPRVRALDLEIKRKDISYTITTIESILARRPQDRLHLVIGADQLVQFTRWHRWQDILERAILLVAPRAEIDFDAAQHQLELAGARILRLRMPTIAISSSMIRRYCAEGRSIRYMVHDHVYRYIRRHHLYGASHEH